MGGSVKVEERASEEEKPVVKFLVGGCGQD
jgi:hypothetical protein